MYSQEGAHTSRHVWYIVGHTDPHRNTQHLHKCKQNQRSHPDPLSVTDLNCFVSGKYIHTCNVDPSCTWVQTLSTQQLAPKSQSPQLLASEHRSPQGCSPTSVVGIDPLTHVHTQTVALSCAPCIVDLPVVSLRHRLHPLAGLPVDFQTHLSLFRSWTGPLWFSRCQFHQLPLSQRQTHTCLQSHLAELLAQLASSCQLVCLDSYQQLHSHCSCWHHRQVGTMICSPIPKDNLIYTTGPFYLLVPLFSLFLPPK